MHTDSSHRIEFLRIWQLILCLSLLLALLRIGFIINAVNLLILYLQLFISQPSFAINQITFAFADAVLSVLILIIIICSVIFERKKKLLGKKINFSAVAVIILFFLFIFAPVFADNNPDFQKNLQVTKLLPPFSAVKVLHLKDENNSGNDIADKFIRYKNRVVKMPFDESIIFVDSACLLPKGQADRHACLSGRQVSSRSGITYYQNGIESSITSDKVIINNHVPFVTTRLFILGTDELGRDIFSRLVYGTRISLFVGLGSVTISFLLGLLLGFLAGYSGGVIDTIISRLTDMFLAFPVIFFIILIIALFGSSIFSVIVVLGFSGWMSLFKIIRGEVISIKNKDFFITAQLIGVSRINLLLKEILPVILVPIVVNLVFQYGNVILAEAALSYLGLGTGSNNPSWGSMIEAGQNYLSQAWWMILFPGLALFFTLYAANSIGKEINSYFNPQLKV